MSSTNPTAPDQRDDRRDVPMTRSLETLMAAEPNATVMRVLEMLDECVPLERAGYRCLNPTCTELCAWPKMRGQGRPKLFCSKSCRQQHDRVRERLVAEVKDLEAVRTRADTTRRQGEELSSAIGQRRWALARYVGVDFHAETGPDAMTGSHT